MKLRSPVPPRKNRLEIIPLIDIMFFLLASFMLVSLTMSRQQTVKVQLPVAAGGAREVESDPIHLAVDAAGGVHWGERKLSFRELGAELAARHAERPAAAVSISGDKEARHGAMVELLEAVRRAGFQKVAFQVQAESLPAGP